MSDLNLLQLFKDDIDTARRLLELIDIEHTALGEKDLPHLQSIINEKLPLLGLLEQHGNLRSHTLTTMQLSPDAEGLQQYAQRIAEGPQLLELADELNTLLERCREANLRNGRIIRVNQTTLASMLEILRGGEAPGLYDSRGSAARIGGQRPLSQA
ncbi:flagella synthesis protein FlgN [Pseudomonas sp. LRF_L74]|uniref:flagella synthesis protein FlgN n=1 Tax=Pseudomonas sp. LRF_L74 TaxID=3369422 RepID=UPI003F631B1A